jgi:peroxisomal enoyl-CoA hydratase 2
VQITYADQELHPNFTAFPTYPIILPFKHTELDVIDFYARQSTTRIPDVPKFDSRRVLDGERKIEFHKTLPTTSAGKKFYVKSKVIGVYDKGKPGSVVETEQVLVERTGEKDIVYTRAVGSAFFVGQGGWGGPKGENLPVKCLFRENQHCFDV